MLRLKCKSSVNDLGKHFLWGLSSEQTNHSNILQDVIVGIFDLSLLLREFEGGIGIHLPGIHYSLFGSGYTQV